jgi:hypothetical protein
VNNILLGAQITKPFILQFSLASCCFLPLGLEYLSQDPLLVYPPPLMLSFVSGQNNRLSYGFYCFGLHVLGSGREDRRSAIEWQAVIPPFTFYSFFMHSGVITSLRNTKTLSLVFHTNGFQWGRNTVFKSLSQS